MNLPGRDGSSLSRRRVVFLFHSSCFRSASLTNTFRPSSLPLTAALLPPQSLSHQGLSSTASSQTSLLSSHPTGSHRFVLATQTAVRPTNGKQEAYPSVAGGSREIDRRGRRVRCRSRRYETRRVVFSLSRFPQLIDFGLFYLFINPQSLFGRARVSD